jgi:hypothetical protein
MVFLTAKTLGVYENSWVRFVQKEEDTLEPGREALGSRSGLISDAA